MLSRKYLKLLSILGLTLLLLSSTAIAQGSGDTDGDDDTDDTGNTSHANDPADTSKPPVILTIGVAQHIEKNLTANGSYQATAYFQLTINTKLSTNDLVIMVTGREDFSHSPALMYSKVNTFPDMTSENNMSCGLTGHDFCIIPGAEIFEKEVIYLSVYCQDSCKFDIVAKYDITFSQNLNEAYRYDYNKDEPYLMEVKIHLPNDLSDDIEHIIIDSYVLNYYQVKSNFHMYVNKGDFFPTPVQYDFITEAMKLNGQSVLIERKADGFQAGMTFSVTIEVPAKGSMLLRSEAFPRERPIYFFKDVDDMVKEGGVRFFKLEISQYTSTRWDQADISFDLEPFFGNPDMYIIHNALPSDPYDLSQYTWHSSESSGIESITMTKHSLGLSSFIGETFYIAVNGISAATFNLLAYSSSLDDRELLFDTVETGYAVDQDIISYQFYVAEPQDVDITINLSAIQGSNSLYIRKCKNISKISECQITSDYITKTAQSDSFLRSEERVKQHKLTFRYSASECIDAKQRRDICTYVVAVQGSSKSQSEYRLFAKHSASSFLIKEGEEYRSYIMEGQIEYFQFPIAIEDLSIVKVEFTVTTISGQIEVFSSRTNPQPNMIDSDYAQFASDDTITYELNAQNTSLKGSYYFSVSAVTGSIFTFHVKIYRQNRDNQVSASIKQITLGSVEKGYLTYEQPHQYYFRVPQEDRSPQHETSISLYFDAFQNNEEQDVAIMPTISIHYLFNNTMFPVDRAQEDLVSLDFIYITVKSQYLTSGRYVITLQHKDVVKKEYQIEYQLNVNADNVIYIIPKVSYISELTSGENDNYELYLSKAQRVYLEVFECFGQVKVQAANTLENIELGKYDVKTSTPSRFIGDHLIVNYERNQTGPFYLALSPVTGIPIQGMQRSLYMIVPHVLPSQQVSPHEVFSTPAEGQIQSVGSFAFDSEFGVYVSKLDITFGPIECANNCEDSIYTATSFEYTVHITNRQNLMQYYSKCDLQTYQLPSLGFNVTGLIHLEQSIEIESSKQASNYTLHFLNLNNDTYYIEIMGVVYFETKHTNNPEPFTFIYPMHQFVLGEKNAGSNDDSDQLDDLRQEPKPLLPPWMTFLLGLALLLLVLICIYKQVNMFIIRRRYRIAMEAQEREQSKQDIEGAADAQQQGGNINDEDEVQPKGKTDKLNLFKN